MTFHGSLLDALARVLGCTVDDLPTGQPYDDCHEARMSHVAETWDPESNTCQPLRPRKDYR